MKPVFKQRGRGGFLQGRAPLHHLRANPPTKTEKLEPWKFWLPPG